MTQEEVLQLQTLAEYTAVQLKERITREDRYDIACEMVAMSNSKGGRIVVGIKDKTGELNPMSYVEIAETNRQLSEMAMNSVVPNIAIETENVSVPGGAIVVATIKRGPNIPYRDNKGIIWEKNGADKTRVTDNAKVMQMMAEGGIFHPDAMSVAESGYKDLDEIVLKTYILNRFAANCKELGLNGSNVGEMSADELSLRVLGQTTCQQLLKNTGLMREDGSMTISGLMLFGKFPQRWLPTFTIRCVSFVGNSQAGSQFRDKSDALADGNIPHLYKYVMTFLQRNLRNVQIQSDFNTLGELEIPIGALSEVVANALIHRSYVKTAPVRVFIFDNRVEIHSPGLLPEGIDVETLRRGTSYPVNELLFNHAIYLLPYTGVGTGIMRALELEKNMEMVNDEGLQEFVVTFYRTISVSDQGNDRVDDRVNDRDPQTKSLEDSNSNKEDKNGNDRVNDRVAYKSLSGVQKNIVQFCSVPRSSREILKHIGYSYHPTHIAMFIRPLLQMRFIEMTIPDKPNSRNQKYRKVVHNV